MDRYVVHGMPGLTGLDGWTDVDIIKHSFLYVVLYRKHYC